MGSPATLAQRTSNGEIATASTPYQVYAVVLTGGSDAATVTLKTGGSGGTTLLTLAAAAGVSVPMQFPNGVTFHRGIYATLTGTGPSVSVAYG